MCDGSLALRVDENAREGDQIVVKTFKRGRIQAKLFAKKCDRDCAVCLPFGAAVRFAILPTAILQRLSLEPQPLATLMSPDSDRFTTRDDIFRFVNGATLRLSEIPEGNELVVIPVAEFKAACDARIGYGVSSSPQVTRTRRPVVETPLPSDRIRAAAQPEAPRQHAAVA